MSLRLAFIAAIGVTLVTAGSTWAGDVNVIAIKGKVVDDNGKPADAEIHVRALDRKAPDTVVLTDSRGHYIVTNLVVGKYSVTAHDDMGYARSRATVDVPRKGWAKVDFDLALDKDVGNDASRIHGHAHFVSPSSHGSPINAIR